MTNLTVNDMPGMNCGICGFRTCEAFVRELDIRPELIERCLHLSKDVAANDMQQDKGHAPKKPPKMSVNPGEIVSASPGCQSCQSACATVSHAKTDDSSLWRDSLGREFEFYLEHFPEDPGPREIILPHNPQITRELDIRVGDILIGRPLGMSCGCPITHCGVAVEVDVRTGVLVWCVTGPLQPRQKGYKDLGYYIAEGYEGLIKETRCEIKIGMRYYFQPKMYMLQWRHSGLVNYLNRTSEGLNVRLEGLWIG